MRWRSRSPRGAWEAVKTESDTESGEYESRRPLSRDSEKLRPEPTAAAMLRVPAVSLPIT